MLSVYPPRLRCMCVDRSLPVDASGCHDSSEIRAALMYDGLPADALSPVCWAVYLSEFDADRTIFRTNATATSARAPSRALVVCPLPKPLSIRDDETGLLRDGDGPSKRLSVPLRQRLPCLAFKVVRHFRQQCSHHTHFNRGNRTEQSRVDLVGFGAQLGQNFDGFGHQM